MPNSKPIVQYLDRQYQFKVPFMMYANFEFILEPVKGTSNNSNLSSTREVNIHLHLDGVFIPNSFMEM